MIKFVDLTEQYKNIGKEIEDGVKSVLSSGRYVGGEHVERFEENFANYIGTKYCATVGSGTDAIMLALKALTGDSDYGEIITAPNTFVATVEAIMLAGFKPKFVDIDPETGLMNLDELEDTISDKTVGVIPVHLYGQVVDMERLTKIADKYGAYVIEDACQAHGATFKGKKAGSFGDFGCFSFYPSKNLGCAGDGGAITTNDEYFYKKILALRDHGQLQKHVHSVVGHTSRLDAIQACILGIKLKYLDEWNGRRRVISWIYDRNFMDSDLYRDGELDLLEIDPKTNPVFHLYVVKVEDRAEIISRLEKANVQYGIHYPTPIHKQPGYEKYFGKKHYWKTEAFCEKIISLPMYPELPSTEAGIVCNAIKGII